MLEFLPGARRVKGSSACFGCRDLGYGIVKFSVQGLDQSQEKP